MARPAPSDEHQPASPATQRWTMVAAVLGAMMTIVDVTAMNVVAPTIQAELETDLGKVQWVLSAYTLMFASLVLVGGALSDRMGRLEVFGTGTATFGLASLVIALAPQVELIIAARAVQGIGAALMVPGSLSLIGAIYEGRARSRAIGRWSGASALGAVIGPMLGGILSDLFSWRLVFLVNLPIVVALLLVIVLRLRHVRALRDRHDPGADAPRSVAGAATDRTPDTEPNTRPGRRLDLTGAALVTVGLGLLSYALIRTGLTSWRDGLVQITAVVGLLLIVTFLVHERRLRDPMVPLHLFEHPVFSRANLFTFFIYLSLAAGMFFVPMRLIQLDGYRPLYAGFAAMPVAFTIGLLSGRMGDWGGRFGTRRFLIGGALVAGAGYALLGAAPAGPVPPSWAGYFRWTFPGLLAVGIGMSAIAAPVSDAVLGAVPRQHHGLAAGVNNAVSRLAALAGIVVSGLVALSVFAHWLGPALWDDPRLDEDTREAAWAERVNLGAATVPSGLDEAPRRAVAAHYDHAFGIAYRGVQWGMATSCLAGAIVAFGLPRRAEGTDDETARQAAAAPSRT